MSDTERRYCAESASGINVGRRDVALNFATCLLIIMVMTDWDALRCETWGVFSAI